MMIWAPANAILRRETYDNYPAAKAILSCVFEGLQLPMDLALAVESRYFAKILRSKEAAAMIRSLFVSMGELNKGARRPREIPPAKLRKIGVLGAGFMGAGVAYVSASAGLDVVLIDRDQETADKGKAHSEKLVSTQIAKGRARSADRDALLQRIHPSADYADLKGCDLVVEAVFEDRAVKKEATEKAQAVLGAGRHLRQQHLDAADRLAGRDFAKPGEFHRHPFLFAGRSNDAGRDHRRREDGPKSAGDRDRLRARDQEDADRRQRLPRLLRQPLRRQFHRRSPPDADAGRAAGDDRERRENGGHAGRAACPQRRSGDRPELENPPGGQKRSWRRRRRSRAGKAARGDGGQESRYGRKNGKGFYDYPANGPKTLWPGLAKIAGKALDPDRVGVSDLKDRFLFVQALEAARCVEEGVVTDPREADVGSILGFGFAPFTGGVLSLIDGMGGESFVARAEALAAAYGPRFAPSAGLVEMAAKGETFYGKAAAKACAA